MNTIEQLKAELENRTNAIIEEAKEKATIAGIQAQLDVVNSSAYQEAKVHQEQVAQRHAAMVDRINSCKAIVSAVPVMDKKTRQEKKWNGRPTYGLGKDLELLHELASGLLYSVDEHKQLMQSKVNLDLLTVESFLTSLGNTAYYSSQYETIVPEVPYNVQQAKSAAMLLGSQLGLALDLTSLTEENMADRFAKARIKAEKDKLEDELLDTSSHFTMS